MDKWDKKKHIRLLGTLAFHTEVRCFIILYGKNSMSDKLIRSMESMLRCKVEKFLYGLKIERGDYYIRAFSYTNYDVSYTIENIINYIDREIKNIKSDIIYLTNK